MGIDRSVAKIVTPKRMVGPLVVVTDSLCSDPTGVRFCPWVSATDVW
jgi:hypothetical protein